MVRFWSPRNVLPSTVTAKAPQVPPLACVRAGALLRASAGPGVSAAVAATAAAAATASARRRLVPVQRVVPVIMPPSRGVLLRRRTIPAGWSGQKGDDGR